jgi:hypothetical protein
VTAIESKDPVQVCSPSAICWASATLETMEAIREAGGKFQSLSGPWAETTTHAGKMIMTIFAGIAEFERALIRERTGAGREAARKRGVRHRRRADHMGLWRWLHPTSFRHTGRQNGGGMACYICSWLSLACGDERIKEARQNDQHLFWQRPKPDYRYLRS